MKHVDEFRRELESRFIEADNQLAECVIEVLGWHIPEEFKSECFPAMHLNRRNNGDCEMCVLVMPRAARSLWHSLGSERIARYSMDTSLAILRQVVEQVRDLHSSGLVHCDIKPRNILVTETNSHVLCDMDAAVPLHTVRPDHLKWSSAYAPPELMRHLNCSDNDKTAFIVLPSFDVWSIGVILFELCTGRHLFSQDLSDDSVVDVSDISRICLWQSINDSLLENVMPGETEDNRKNEIQHLIRWCLQGNPFNRPSIEQILDHCIFGGQSTVPRDNYITIPSELDGVLLSPIIEQNGARMKYHTFISHYQAEASGDVGTLYHMLHRLGVHMWRDMNTLSLTDDAMRQGVYDSDVFILFLTNAALSRYFCLKEVTWALEFGKPIIIVVEEDERLWSWDINRWTEDKCCRIPGSLSNWTTGWLQHNYTDIFRNHRVVHDLIHRYSKDGLMLPFRRREFEVNALVKKIIHQSSSSAGVCWKLPLRSTKDTSFLYIPRNMYMINSSESSELASRLKADLSLISHNYITLANEIDTATHIVVVLSGLVLEECSHILDIALRLHETKGIPIVYMYSTELGWDFNKFYNDTGTAVKKHIASNEALVYRSHSYEQVAVNIEIVRRLTCNERIVPHDNVAVRRKV